MAKRRLDRNSACNILSTSGAGRNSDFHALSSTVVERLLDAAGEVGYRKPKNANGSRGRYFHAYLQRLCK